MPFFSKIPPFLAVLQFVFGELAIERALEALELPATSGVVGGTCGVDVAVVRRVGGGSPTRREGDGGRFEVRVMELNARTTMSHYALAAKARLPRAVSFEVLRRSELAERGPNVVELTDGEASRRRESCHSAAPPSPFSRRFNMDGEGMSAK